MTDDFKKEANHDNKENTREGSSADNVTEYLQALESSDSAVTREQLYYSQEQQFSPEQLASVINERRLTKLLAQSDDFLTSLSSEIKDFDQDSGKDNH